MPTVFDQLSDHPNRWETTQRDHTWEDILNLRGTKFFRLSYPSWIADKLWNSLLEARKSKEAVRALGALTGNQAVQQAEADLQAIYLSGWQVAADANLSGEMYPDQSLYPADSVPNVVQRINYALERADQINRDKDYYKPIIADAEAGFGGILNAFELMKGMIRAGAAGVHFEDQLSSAKKCGHLGGKVLVPTSEFINKLKAARIAADVLGTGTIIIARTDANSARMMTSDIDDRDHPFITNPQRTAEGFHKITGGLDMAIARGLAYAPYADLLWCETSTPDLGEAKRFAEAIHAAFPGKMLAYNCSPSFRWSQHEDKTGPVEHFQDELAEMGYNYQFITLAGFHALNHSMFELALDYNRRGMKAYRMLQEAEYSNYQHLGFKAVKHQQFVGTGYFDQVQKVITGGGSSTTAMDGSTEEAQF
jgi:isocitrate lyase